jgi:transcriptional regulator of acetoin/glycerol metabolism
MEQSNSFYLRRHADEVVAADAADIEQARIVRVDACFAPPKENDRKLPPDAIPVVRPDGTLRTLAEMEWAMIDFAMVQYRSLSKAARALGVARSTLYRKLGEPR